MTTAPNLTAAAVVDVSTAVVWGRDLTRAEIDAALEQNAADTSRLGASDDRVTYRNALLEGLRKLELTRTIPTAAAATKQAAAKQPVPAAAQGVRYSGQMVSNRATGTTHFTNSFGETFCGTHIEWVNEIKQGTGRASCRRCQQAGDSFERDPGCRTGSAARR